MLSWGCCFFGHFFVDYNVELGPLFHSIGTKSIDIKAMRNIRVITYPGGPTPADERTYSSRVSISIAEPSVFVPSSAIW